MATSSTSTTASGEDSAHRGVKLNESNYGQWKVQMFWDLRAAHLWEFAETPPPVAPTSEWETKNAQAMRRILFSLTAPQMMHVEAKMTAYDAWTALKGVYERKSMGTRTFLLRRFYTIRMTGSQAVQNYVDSFQAMIHKLAAIGFVVDPDSQVCTFQNQSLNIILAKGCCSHSHHKIKATFV